MFNVRQDRLFKAAYASYRKIYKFCVDNMDLYTQKHGTEEKIAVVMLSDIEVQYILLEVADLHSCELSESEKIFIRSIIESTDILKSMVPGYGRFIRNMTAANYVAVKNELAKQIYPVPISLAIATMKNDEAVSEIYHCWVNILNSFTALTEEKSKKLSANVMKLLDEYSAYIEKEGFSISGGCDLQANGSVGNDSNYSASRELEGLVGLSTVKKAIADNLNFLRVNKIRKKEGLPQITITRNFVFTGNAGTGKTSVARIMAKIYYENGITSNGKFVETDRSGLVDAYVGGTAQKVLNVVESAIGGVLFIDEAYALTASDSDRDFGKEAIATLVKLMDDNRDDLIVIVAGYKDEMKKFIDSNPGLKSRFTSFIDFEDYSADEMQEIYNRFAKKDGYILDKACSDKLSEIWNRAGTDSSFGNGRGVRNVYEKTIINLSSRVVTVENASKNDLILILPQDIPKYSEVLSVEKEQRKIGFQ